MVNERKGGVKNGKGVKDYINHNFFFNCPIILNGSN